MKLNKVEEVQSMCANEPVFTVRRLAVRAFASKRVCKASAVVVNRSNYYYYYYYYCGYSNRVGLLILIHAQSTAQHKALILSLSHFIRAMPVRCFIFIIMHFKLKIYVFSTVYGCLMLLLLLDFFLSRLHSISVFHLLFPINFTFLSESDRRGRRCRRRRRHHSKHTFSIYFHLFLCLCNG